jgi:hypothetical protein
MEALARAAAEAGFWKLVSRVMVSNAASRGLLASVGFREVGVYRRHARLEGTWRDVVVVEQLIGEAADDPGSAAAATDTGANGAPHAGNGTIADHGTSRAPD